MSDTLVRSGGRDISPYLVLLLDALTPFSILCVVAIVFPFFDFNNIEWLNVVKHVGYRAIVVVVIFATALRMATSPPGRGRLRTGLESGFLFYLVSIVISIAAARFVLPFPLADRLIALVSIVLLMGFYYSVVYWIHTPASVERLTRYMLVTGFVLTCLSMVQQLIGIHSLYRPSGRLAGIFWDPNIFARYEIILLCFVLPIVILTKPRGKTLFFYLLFGFFAFCGILFSLSRSGYLTLLFLFVVLSLITMKKRYLPLVLAIALGISVAGYYYIVENRALGGGGVLEASSINRAGLILAGIGMIEEHWLVGVGYGNYPVALEDLYAGSSVLFSETYKYAQGITTTIHNWMIEIWAEQGLIGLAAFGLLFYLALKNLYRAQAAALNPLHRSILIGHYLVILVFLFHGFFYHVFISQFFFWVLFAMAMASVKAFERSRTNGEQLRNPGLVAGQSGGR